MGQKIAIASGKGGTGKTTVAVNLFELLTELTDRSISLVDCDVEEPNDMLYFKDAIIKNEENVYRLLPVINRDNCTFCKKCSEYCEYNAITIVPSLKFTQIATDLCHSCGACSYACDFDSITEIKDEIGKITEFTTNNKQTVIEGRLKVGLPFQTPVIEELKEKAKYKADIILYDAPPGTSCSVVNSLLDVDYVILVAEPSSFGIHDFKLILDLVKEMGIQYGVIINKAQNKNTDLKDYLKEINADILAEIPFTKEVALENSNAKLLTRNKEYIKHYTSLANKIIYKKLINERNYSTQR